MHALPFATSRLPGGRMDKSEGIETTEILPLCWQRVARPQFGFRMISMVQWLTCNEIQTLIGVLTWLTNGSSLDYNPSTLMYIEGRANFCSQNCTFFVHSACMRIQMWGLNAFGMHDTSNLYYIRCVLKVQTLSTSAWMLLPVHKHVLSTWWVLRPKIAPLWYSRMQKFAQRDIQLPWQIHVETWNPWHSPWKLSQTAWPWLIFQEEPIPESLFIPLTVGSTLNIQISFCWRRQPQASPKGTGRPKAIVP